MLSPRGLKFCPGAPRKSEIAIARLPRAFRTEGLVSGFREAM